jgi:16S rRNA (cytosine1402-N4)-methyltransferase
MEARHESVLLEEAVDWLRPASGKILLDGTVGLGGHARRWLEQSSPDGQVVGFDRDPEAVLEARRVLENFGGRAVIRQGNFKDCWPEMERLGHLSVDAILLDLGVSSLQLDTPRRGFSFRGDGPLDMRMDPAQTLDAEKLVNGASQKELEDILWKFGEERFARRIARRICEARRVQRIRTTGQLEGIIFQAVPAGYRHGRIHPATRSFQALRLAVNGELEALEGFLSEVSGHLKPGGRLAVISFHSLEDRIVKRAFREMEKKGMVQRLTKKPATPGEGELARNPRARSAKIRVLEMREGPLR